MTRAVVIYGLALLCLLWVWSKGIYALDAVAFAVAGRLWLAGNAGTGLYTWPMSQDVITASCTYSPDECWQATPFLSPPIALPLAVVMVPWVVQATGALSVAWVARVTATSHRAAWLWVPLPWVLIGHLQLGQNVLWIPACVAAATFAPAGVAGALLGLLILVKVSPAVLVLPLVLWWRQRELGACLGVLLTAGVVWALVGATPGFSEWRAFMAHMYPIIVTNAGNLALPDAGRACVFIAWMVGITLIRCLCKDREAGFTAAWHLSWFLWPWLLPLVWGHYLWAPLTVLIVEVHLAEAGPRVVTGSVGGV